MYMCTWSNRIERCAPKEQCVRYEMAQNIFGTVVLEHTYFCIINVVPVKCFQIENVDDRNKSTNSKVL